MLRSEPLRGRVDTVLMWFLSALAQAEGFRAQFFLLYLAAATDGRILSFRSSRFDVSTPLGAEGGLQVRTSAFRSPSAACS